MNFIDELLADQEQKELALNKLRADQVLMAVSVLERHADEVNKLADDEIKIIEEYRQSELQKIEKKASWLVASLEAFMRSSNEKTMNLPHGTMKLRMGRDKIVILDQKQFTQYAASRGLLRSIPESFEPDLAKIHDYIQRTRTVPDGVQRIPAKTKFSYTTLKGQNGDAEQSEVRAEAERGSQAEAEV